MFKKTLLISTILATTTSFAASTAPYVGASLGIINNTSSSVPYATQTNSGQPTRILAQPGNFRGVPLNVFAGFGGVINQNFYLAGELFGTVATAEISSNNGLKTSYGYGVSILPGFVLSDHTLAFVRGGLVRTRFSDANNTETGGQVGVGLQATLTQNMDVRGEYDYTSYGSFNNSIGKISSPTSDAFNAALIYKFD